MNQINSEKALSDSFNNSNGISDDRLQPKTFCASSGGRAWSSALTLDSQRKLIAGSESQLVAAIRRGADLRIYTEFTYNEHIDLESDNDEVVQEVSSFPVTYLLDNRWVAGIMTQRLPVEPPNGFGERPSMSFFMYNQNGQQAVARPYLDRTVPAGDLGLSLDNEFLHMPKMHQHDCWDANTNAPSSNFVYDFDIYRFFVRDDWDEVLAHDKNGEVIQGSYLALSKACAQGAEVKVSVRNLCKDMPSSSDSMMDHEVFCQGGWVYNHRDSKLVVMALHPLVRVSPAIPISYKSSNWDFGWLIVRTDGYAAHWMVDPYTLKFEKSDATYALRWFVRK